jgi:AcrR family transcriptional regulator
LPRKAGYHHGDLRQGLVLAAERLVEANGGKELTLRAVARTLGVTAAATYRHFADKDTLLAAVLANGFRELATATEAARREAPTPAAALMAAGVAYTRFAAQRPAIYRLMFGPECDKASHPELLAAGADAFGVLTRAVDACHDAGLLRGEPKQVVLLGWAVVHGLASLHTDGALTATLPELTDVESTARELIPLLLGGVVNEPKRLPAKARRAPKRPVRS